MTWARQYLFRLILCAFLVVLVQALPQNRRTGLMIRLLCGCLLVLAALTPLMQPELSAWDDSWMEEILGDGSVTPNWQEKTDEILEELVRTQTQQRIREKAEELGLRGEYRVKCRYDPELGGYVPDQAEILAPANERQRLLLTEFISQQLAIPEQRQRWVIK